MDILIIVILVLLGLVLIVTEILVFPGVTIAGIGAAASIFGAMYLCFINYGSLATGLLFVAIIILAILTFMFAIRSKSIKKLSLEKSIDSKSSEDADISVAIGDKGFSTTRLAPMGNIIIDGMSFEAKSRDGFVDERVPVKVVGFERSVVIVTTFIS